MKKAKLIFLGQKTLSLLLAMSFPKIMAVVLLRYLKSQEVYQQSQVNNLYYVKINAQKN